MKTPMITIGIDQMIKALKKNIRTARKGLINMETALAHYERIQGDLDYHEHKARTSTDKKWVGGRRADRPTGPSDVSQYGSME